MYISIDENVVFICPSLKSKELVNWSVFLVLGYFKFVWRPRRTNSPAFVLAYLECNPFQRALYLFALFIGLVVIALLF